MWVDRKLEVNDGWTPSKSQILGLLQPRVHRNQYRVNIQRFGIVTIRSPEKSQSSQYPNISDRDIRESTLVGVESISEHFGLWQSGVHNCWDCQDKVFAVDRIGEICACRCRYPNISDRHNRESTLIGVESISEHFGSSHSGVHVNRSRVNIRTFRIVTIRSPQLLGLSR